MPSHIVANFPVKTTPKLKEVTPAKGGESHLTVNYHALTSILIESIKELSLDKIYDTA